MAWTYEHTWKLPSSPDAVFLALTDRNALTEWFAEFVDVGHAVGQPFRFWGRHSLDTPTEARATQRLTQWEHDRMLGFTWQIGGIETEVVIMLEAVDAKCTLVLRQIVSATLPYPREKALLDDHWRFVFGNLAAFLSGDGGIVRPDFSDPSPEVRQTVLIGAPPSTVFKALITPALVNEWFGSKAAIIEPHVGGRYSVGWEYQIDGRDVVGGPTRILEYVENERLVLDWPDWRGDESVTGQTISFQLEAVGDQTRLTFVHAGFSRTADMSDYPFGWTWFLSQLIAVTIR